MTDMNNTSYTSDALPLAGNPQKMIETRFVGPEMMIGSQDLSSQIQDSFRRNFFALKRTT